MGALKLGVGTHNLCLVPEAIIQHESGVMSLLQLLSTSKQAPWAQKAELRPWPGERPSNMGSLGIPHIVSRRPFLWSALYGGKPGIFPVVLGWDLSVLFTKKFLLEHS